MTPSTARSFACGQMRIGPVRALAAAGHAPAMAHMAAYARGAQAYAAKAAAPGESGFGISVSPVATGLPDYVLAVRMVTNSGD